MTAATPQLLGLLLQALPVAVLAFDVGGRPCYANEQACDLLGDGIRPGADFQGELFPPYVAGTEELYPREEIPIIRALRGEEANADDLELRRPDGVIAVAAWAKPVRDDSGTVIAAISTFTDITDRRKAERALVAAENLFREAFTHAPTGMALAALDGTVIQVNSAFCTILGHSERDLIGRTLAHVTHPDELADDLAHVAALVAGREHSYSVERRYRQADGSVVWGRLSASLVRGATEDPEYFIWHLQDVTADRQRTEQLHDAAHTDELTNLPNRRGALENVAAAQAHATATGTHAAVVFIDLDNFKSINDSCGHDAGDEVLVEVADRLRGSLRPSDSAARLGGDEFLCCLVGLDEDTEVAEQQAAAVTRRLHRALDRPFLVNERALRVEASIGFALTRGADDGAPALIAAADREMYLKKVEARERRGASGAGKVDDAG